MGLPVHLKTVVQVSVLVMVATLVATMVAGYALLRYQDHRHIKNLIEEAVTDASGRRLIIHGDLAVGLSLTPELVVKDATLANVSWGSKPKMVTIGLLRIRLSLLPLLKREVKLKDIQLADTRVLLETDSAGQGNWHFSAPDADRAESAIGKLSIKRLRVDRLVVTYRGAEPGAAEEHYTLDHLDLRYTQDRKSVAVEFEGTSKGQALSLTGNTGRLSELFSGSRFPLDLSGELAGARVSIKGSIADVLTLTGIDLDVQTSGSDLAAVGVALGTRLPQTRSFTLKAQLAGGHDDVSVQQLKGSFDTPGMRLAVTGSIGDLARMSAVQLDVNGSGNDLAKLGPALDRDLPSSGPFRISGRISGTASDLALSDAQAAIVAQTLKLSLSGSIDDLLNMQGIDLEVEGSGDDLARFGAMVGHPLPETGAFSVSGRISGTASHLALSNAQCKIARQSLTLSLAGSVADLLKLEGIDLKVEGLGSDLAQIGPIVGQSLPRTSPFTVRGKLTGSATAPALSRAQGHISRKHVELSASGGIRHLRALEGIDLSWKLSGKSLAGLDELLNTTLPPTGAFDLTGRLTGSPEKLRLADLRGRVRHQQAKLDITGSVDDLAGLQGIDLGFEGAGKNLAELGNLFDAPLPDLGPFSLSGRLRGSRSRLYTDAFSAYIDNSDFNGWASVAFSSKPKITVRLESGLIDFTRLMDQLQDAPREKAAGTGPGGQTLFSREPLPFELLAAVDADISLHARNIRARDAALELGQLALQIDDGRLRMDTLEATYKTARLSAKLNSRAGPPAHVSASFLVQGFELGDFLQESGITDEVEAKADIAADLRSLGQSTHGLVSNLDGVFAVVIGKGKVPRFLDLLAEDLSLRVIPIWGKHKEAGTLKCGVVQFGIQRGVATSEAFLFDTKIGYLNGQGRIWLPTQQIDFLLSPSPKKASLFSLKTKVRVRGSLSDPTVSPDTKSLLKKGSKALSTLVLGPAGLLAPFISLGAHNRHPCDMPALRGRLDQIYP